MNGGHIATALRGKRNLVLPDYSVRKKKTYSELFWLWLWLRCVLTDCVFSATVLDRTLSPVAVERANPLYLSFGRLREGEHMRFPFQTAGSTSSSSVHSHHSLMMTRTYIFKWFNKFLILNHRTMKSYGQQCRFFIYFLLMPYSDWCWF